MSDEWNTVTKIGSGVSGPGASQRETVVRGKAALNQAQRSGAVVGTEKKFATGNAAVKAGSEGQRLTKVDRADDIIAPQKTSKEVGTAISVRRSQPGPYKYTQSDLAKKVNAQAKQIKDLESGEGKKDQQLLNRVCGVLKLSPKTGKPLDEGGEAVGAKSKK